MSAPTLDQLADEYLRTPDGRTAQDACGLGLWCGDGDVDAWAGVVKRIRADMMRQIKRTPQVTYSDKLKGEAAAWGWKALQVRTGSWGDVFGGGTAYVQALVSMARIGVELLHQLQVEADKQGAPIVGPGPKGPAGVDWQTVALFGGVALILIIAIQAARA